MRGPKVAILSLTMAIGAAAGENRDTKQREVRVCMNPVTDRTVFSAQLEASRMFQELGVKLEWRVDAHLCAAEAGIAITLETVAPATFHPGELAYAMPYERRSVVVFLDRVKASAFAPLLGYVFVHEIAHILQGVARHSQAGILRARWERGDYAEMRRGRLAFTEEDVRLIHRGLETRPSGWHSPTPTLVAGAK